MRLKDILKEAASQKHAFAGESKSSLKEDKPKTAPSDDKLKNMGNKKSAEKAGHELTGVTRSLDKEKDFKLKKKDVDATKVTDGYGNDIDVDTANPHATEQRAEAEVENLKEFQNRGQIRLAKLMARILPEAEEPEPTDNGESNPPKTEPQGQEHQKSDSQAADQAHKLGLTAKPYGNWADDTGKVVAKTVKGQLTKLDPKEKQAKNAEAPTDSGEFAPPAKSSEKPASSVGKPKSEPAQSNPMDDLHPAEIDALKRGDLAPMSSQLSQNVPDKAKRMKANMKISNELIRHFGSATEALKIAGKQKNYPQLYGRVASGIDELSRTASADMYETMHEIKAKSPDATNTPAWKHLAAIADLGAQIEEESGSDIYSPQTKAMMYDVSRKYNDQLAGNAHSIDPDDAEADLEELQFTMNDDRERAQPQSREDYEANKADDEYDEWASSGKPKFWHGRRMR